MGVNQFTIENGMVLDGFAKETPDETAFKWPDGDARQVEHRLFVENAHFLFSNRDRIFADSRMFLAPVNVQSGGAYIGAFCKPTVGTYIEWWLRRGQDELAYHVSGSPLSGTNASKSIAKDGSLVPLPVPPQGAFLSLVHEYEHAHKRYLDERKRFEAYSLWEVVQRLRGEAPQYDDGLKVQQLMRTQTRLEAEIEDLKRQNEELRRRVQSFKDRLKNATRDNMQS